MRQSKNNDAIPDVVRVLGSVDTIVVLDLKGAPALFHNIHVAAARHRRQFAQFANHVNYRVHVLNPFTHRRQFQKG